MRAWSDEDAQDTAIVLRRLQETQAQIRNAQNVLELKALYGNACIFYGQQTIMGVDPFKHYSEAAHIKPVGKPHNGPDQKDNMIILSQEHHLQFDCGVLRIFRPSSGLRQWQVVSKIPHDPLNGIRIRVDAPHTLNDDYISWHFNFGK
jgi:predicted restriction endonuclease